MKASWIVAMVTLGCIMAYFYVGCKPVWEFDHLERNARKVITAAELQAWATNFVAQYPTNTSFRPSELGTNFPQRLLPLAPKIGPSIWVYEGEDTNSPGWVMIAWGSGFLGHCGFEVGPTNFAGRQRGHAWQDGVYFWNDNDH